MANEIELNGLADINSLPDDWKISLINPDTLQPAQNIKVAQFIELLTEKMPLATAESKGVIDADFYRSSIVKRYNVIDPNNLDNVVDAGIYLIPYTDGGPYGQLIVFRNYLNAHSAIVQLLFRYPGAFSFRISSDITSGFFEGVPFRSVLGTELSIYTTESNVLTDTIQTSPVLESRQVRSTCLQNHLYQILLPTCQDRMDRMVQHQLKLNHQENSMSGRLTRSERLYSNYKKKTRDLNKSSISLTIARYNKCNLPRAGPPRLIK